MRLIKFRVWFYDGQDVLSGEMLTGEEAWKEGYIEWGKNGLQPIGYNLTAGGIYLMTMIAGWRFLAISSKIRIL